MEKPQAIIFDCDGVLVDSEIIAIAVEREYLGGRGLVYDDETYISRFVGLHNRDYHAALRADASDRGIALPADFPAIIQAAIWTRFTSELRAIRGAVELAAAFHGPVAVASSSEQDKLHRKLEMTGLAPAFGHHIYSADLVEHGKPAPDLFLYAAERLGTAPDTCLIIEDSENGVRAGRSAGMQTVGFTGGAHADAGLRERLEAAGAHHVAASFAEIAALIGAGRQQG
ncbi:HAD family hydrolase [Henriciella marina]|uniref:HAD family hydrolase n=1 Tax=Henriciella marina TaxID=453851 RepID=UPI000378F698|nr:HAD family phosphatase [Henriciella marina]